MNVLTGISPAKGEQKMSSTITETKDTAPVSGKPAEKANVRAQRRRVAPARGKSGNKATAGNNKRFKAPPGNF